MTHPNLVHAFQCMQTLYNSRDYKTSQYYGRKVIQCAKKDSEEYFDSIEMLIRNATSNYDYGQVDTLILDLETYLNQSKNQKLDRYQLMVYRAKMDYSMRLKNYEKAIIYGQKLLIENKEYKQYNEQALSPVYAAISRAYKGLEEFDKALELINKALKPIEANFPEQPIVGSYYFDVADLYRKKGDFKISLVHYDKTIKLFLKDTVRTKDLLRLSYTNKARVYREMKQFDKAIETLKIGDKYGETNNSLILLGQILGLQGKYEAAISLLHSVLIKMSTHFKNPDPAFNPSNYEIYTDKNDASFNLINKGKYEFAWGKKKNDIVLMKRGIKSALLGLHLIQDLSNGTQGFEKSNQYTNRAIFYTITTLTGMYYDMYVVKPSETAFNQVLEFSEKQKAIQLIKTLTPSLLPPNIYKEERKLIKSLQFNGQQLDLMTVQEKQDSILFYQNTLFEISEKLAIHFENISENYPKEAFNFYPSTPLVNDIQQKLSSETLFVEYFKSIKNKYVMAIDKQEKTVFKTDMSSLTSSIKRFNELIQDQFAFQTSVRDEFIDLSHQIYLSLIKPIEAELKGKTKLIIVLEGELFQLPFELLLASNEKKPYHELDFLIKKYEISYHYSATALLRLKEKSTVKNSSLLAFAPVFSKGEELNEATRSLDFMIDTLYQGIDNDKFVALPNTKKEVKAIAKLIKSNNGIATVLLKKKATKANLSTALEKQSYQFVHIATHGLVNFKNPKLSALACYSKNEKIDNFLYANEIQFKNINADLVVLSSCESGLGQLMLGEGLIALNRSFIYSGAKNVLFSLWKVNDKYSSDLMIDFYKYYFEGQSYTEALRQAKLKMLENPTSALPKYWSAFVLIGE